MCPRRTQSTISRVWPRLLAVVTIGCGPAPRSSDAVVYASGADLESANPLVTIHPLARQVQRYALFVTLAGYDSTLAPVPYLAHEWHWSEDRRVLTFTLLESLRWHDGRPTTARDVAFTLDAARDPATGYPRYADLADVTEVRVLDDLTVAVRFVRPQPRFPLVLCELPIVPAHLLAGVARRSMRQAAFNLSTVGNGPFRFVERRAGQRWIFERNPQFPAAMGGPPRIGRLVVAIVDEATTKFAGLVGGDLDVAGIAPSMASLIRDDPALRVLDYPQLFSYAVVFNVRKPPFDDVRIRQAVGLAIDRRRIVEAALAGFGTPAGGPVSPAHPYAAPVSLRQDTTLADSLLDAGGWRRGPSGWRERGGRRLGFDLLTVGSADNAVEQLMQADLAAVGIRMEIRQREMGAFLAEARASEKHFDALFTGVPGDVSLSYLSSMYDSRLAGGALDYGAYHTPELDSLLARARTAPSAAAARQAWLAVQAVLAAATPAAWVYHARGLQGVSKRLRGVRMDLRGELVSLVHWSADTAAPYTVAVP